VNALSAHSEDRGDITETLGNLALQQAVREVKSQVVVYRL